MNLNSRTEVAEFRKCATELLERFSLYSQQKLNEKDVKQFKLSLIQEMENILKMTTGLNEKLIEEMV